jgi:hypothetical protein
MSDEREKTLSDLLMNRASAASSSLGPSAPVALGGDLTPASHEQPCLKEALVSPRKQQPAPAPKPYKESPDQSPDSPELKEEQENVPKATAEATGTVPQESVAPEVAGQRKSPRKDIRHNFHSGLDSRCRFHKYPREEERGTAAEQPSDATETVPVQLQNFPTGLLERANHILQFIFSVCCAPHAAAVQSVTPLTSNSLTALVTSTSVQRVIYALRARVMMDSEGFWYAEDIAQYQELVKYCRSIPQMTPAERRQRFEDIPLKPILIWVDPKFDPKGIMMDAAPPPFDSPNREKVEKNGSTAGTEATSSVAVSTSSGSSSNSNALPDPVTSPWLRAATNAVRDRPGNARVTVKVTAPTAPPKSWSVATRAGKKGGELGTRTGSAKTLQAGPIKALTKA